MSEEKDEPHYTGHRQRLKQRLNLSPESIADYELLELILFFVIPRKDVKPLAKKLLNQFSTLANLINVDKEKLLSVKGTNENLYVSFIIARQLIHRVLKQQIINKNIISSWGALIDYLKVSMGQLKLEQFPRC